MRRPVCLVTGATGAIGPAVVEALQPAYDVRTFSRRPPGAGLFSGAVDSHIGDIAEPRAVARAAAGVDAIVHLTALLHIVDPPPEKRAEYERVNIQGTAAVVEAALSQHVPRVVLMSTIAVYGDTSGAVLTEESAPHPDTLYGETKLAAERVAMAAHRAGGVPLVTVLRAAAVYGPRIKGNYQRLVHAIARGRFIPVGPGRNRRTLVFEEDLASAVALALDHPAAAGRVYNVSDGEFHAMRDIVSAIAAGLGRQPPAWHLPVTAALVGAKAASLFDRRIMGMLETYLEDVAVKAERIQAELGWRPRFNLGRGWAQTIERMRADGALER